MDAILNMNSITNATTSIHKQLYRLHAYICICVLHTYLHTYITLLPPVDDLKHKQINAARRPLPAVWGLLQPGAKTILAGGG